MGIIHLAVFAAVAYAAVWGVTMALGEGLQFGGGAVRLTLADMGLWAGAIMGAGGVAYVLVLALI